MGLWPLWQDIAVAKEDFPTRNQVRSSLHANCCSGYLKRRFGKISPMCSEFTPVSLNSRYRDKISPYLKMARCNFTDWAIETFNQGFYLVLHRKDPNETWLVCSTHWHDIKSGHCHLDVVMPEWPGIRLKFTPASPDVLWDIFIHLTTSFRRPAASHSRMASWHFLEWSFMLGRNATQRNAIQFILCLLETSTNLSLTP